MKAIKDFVDMIEDDLMAAKVRLSTIADRPSRFCEDKWGKLREVEDVWLNAYLEVVESHQFKSLKSLLEHKEPLVAPKKQTFLDFVICDNIEANLDTLTPSEIIKLISEYLEREKMQNSC